MNKDELKIFIWNIQWASPKSKRTPHILHIIKTIDPHIICLTETNKDIIQEFGYSIYSNEDYGYPIQNGRRKVMLWSKEEWINVESVPNNILPIGRYISGMTTTPIGTVFCHGVCIPWADAHVSTGKKDKRKWEEHLTYLKGLSDITKNISMDSPSIILGDFNQRIPRHKQPEHIYNSLQMSLGNRYKIKTSGLIPVINKQSIDHLACTKEIYAEQIYGINNYLNVDTCLSDHFGLVVIMKRK